MSMEGWARAERVGGEVPPVCRHCEEQIFAIEFYEHEDGSCLHKHCYENIADRAESMARFGPEEEP